MASRRLTEAIVNGCVPLFVGPPFHELPFDTYVDYSEFSLAFYVREWRQVLGRFADSPQYTTTFGQKRYLVSSPPPVVIEVDTPHDVLHALRDISAERLKALQAGVARIRSLFMYEPRIEGLPSALDVIMHHVCTVSARKDPRLRRW